MKINIACGDIYVDGWVNYDYAPHSERVIKANLLGKLQLKDCVADVVYSSHFLEHIPLPLVEGFMDECFRILKPDGVLRLVLPDLEDICRSYLQYRADEEHDKADFLQIELLDQMVRPDSGGELGRYYRKIGSAPQRYGDEIAFVMERTGHNILSDSHTHTRSLKILLSKVLGRIEQGYIHALMMLLPEAFRKQNCSTASVGEKHAWMYDYHGVKWFLEQAGFRDVQRVGAGTSRIQDFPFVPLDLNPDGAPRKGQESMYIEAVKQ